MTPLDELRRLAPPPAEPMPLPATDLAVPADYPPLAAAYGVGEFCDLVQLVTPDPERLDDEHELRAEYPEDYPYPLFPEPGGLLVWGSTSNGGLLCWLTEGEPDAWPVVVWHPRDAEFEEHPAGAAEFLAGWLAGRVTSDLLPSVMRERSQWFDQPRRRTFVSVRLSPHEQSLDRLCAALRDPVVRRSTEGQHIVDAEGVRYTYNPGDLWIGFPPGETDRVRASVTAIAAALGCTAVMG